jgi:nucleoside-diphosphate-sugar epimerase
MEFSVQGRIFVTGGSGFIGTNLVQHFRNAGAHVVNFDSAPPRNPGHNQLWIEGDIRDKSALAQALQAFSPNIILHVAARTDLDGVCLDDYSANTDGVQNMISAARSLTSLSRIFFFSSMLVCEFGYIPRQETDYCPSNFYGQSKMEGEKLVRSGAATNLPWVLVRPTSIWGPWFGAPYRGFFEAVRRGWFVLPRTHRSLRSYGYVDNLVAEIAALIAAPDERVQHRTFYLADYIPLDLRDWANRVSRAWNRGQIPEVPLVFLKMAALAGDFAKRIGWSDPPLTRFRLKNLLASAVFDMSDLAAICPTLPVGVDEGIRKTVVWMQGIAQE